MGRVVRPHNTKHELEPYLSQLNQNLKTFPPPSPSTPKDSSIPPLKSPYLMTDSACDHVGSTTIILIVVYLDNDSNDNMKDPLENHKELSLIFIESMNLASRVMHDYPSLVSDLPCVKLSSSPCIELVSPLACFPPSLYDKKY